MALPSLATPLDDDDLLTEILLRLLLLPSSLRHACLVCKRWHRLISNPSFLHSYRVCYQKPPLLGAFSTDFICSGNLYFTHVPDTTTSATRLVVELGCGYDILGCRHGRVLAGNWTQQHFLVWEPLTGGQRLIPFPPAFDGMRKVVVNGAFLCAAREQCHVHGSCHSSPFQVVLLGRSLSRILACVYSSETGEWGNCTWIPRGHFRGVSANHSSTLVGNSVFWLLTGRSSAILEFDMGMQSLDVIEVPSDALERNTLIQVQITPAEGGGLGFLVLSDSTVRLWRRKVTYDGVTEWVLGNTINLANTLSLRPSSLVKSPPLILGFAEDADMLLLLIESDFFTVHLESRQFKKLAENMGYRLCYPFTSFYTPDEFLYILF